MNVADLKIKIFRQVDSLDSSKLEELYGIMQNYINGKREVDEWIGINTKERQGIEASINELDLGKGIPHSQVISKLREKYSQIL